jgi:hypothetical protein
MALTIEEIAAAINSVEGITQEGLAMIMQKSVILTLVEGKRAEVARKEGENLAAAQAYDTAMQAANQSYQEQTAALTAAWQAQGAEINAALEVLRAELAALVTAANASL